MKVSVLAVVLSLAAGAAAAEEAQPLGSKEGPTPAESGWNWAGATAVASGAWARMPSRNDIRNAVTAGGSAAIDTGTKAAASAWEHVPSRADATDAVTAQGAQLLAIGSGAAGAAAGFASDGAAFTLARWQALPNHRRIEDGALTTAIVLPATAGSFAGCALISAKTAPPLIVMASTICGTMGHQVGEQLARSTFDFFGRSIDEDAFRADSETSLVIGTLGVTKIASSWAHGAAARGMKRSLPDLLDPRGAALALPSTTAAPAEAVVATPVPSEVSPNLVSR